MKTYNNSFREQDEVSPNFAL